MKFATLIGLCIFAFSTAKGAELPYSLVGRQALIENEIRALKKLTKPSANKLAESIGESQRLECKSLFDLIVLNCLIGRARTLCEDKSPEYKRNCDAVADLIVTNKLNSDHFIDKNEKLKIAQTGGDYPTAYSKALIRKYSLLTAQFLLLYGPKCSDTDDRCLAIETDRFCQEHSEEKELPWQACVGAIVWFSQVGT